MNTKQHDTDGRIEGFINKLEGLDTADRARLRRNAGRSLEEARSVLGLFYRLVPAGMYTRDEGRYFLVATLFPLAVGGSAGNLGNTLRRAQTPTNRSGLDRRMEILLDADAEQLPFRLRQAVGFAQSQRMPVNWGQLLKDVLFWDDPRRETQRRWAQSYFSTQS